MRSQIFCNYFFIQSENDSEISDWLQFFINKSENILNISDFWIFLLKIWDLRFFVIFYHEIWDTTVSFLFNKILHILYIRFVWQIFNFILIFKYVYYTACCFTCYHSIFDSLSSLLIYTQHVLFGATWTKTFSWCGQLLP